VETAMLKLAVAGLETEGLALATGSDSSERTKIMQLAEQRAFRGVAPTRKAYFGDGAWDKRASEQLGYQFTAIGNGVEHDTRFDNFIDSATVLRRIGVDNW
jgi:hypothetical protein